MTNAKILAYCLLVCDIEKHEGGWFDDTGEPSWVVRGYDKEDRRIFFQYTKENDGVKFYRGHVHIKTPYGIYENDIKTIDSFADVAELLNIGEDND